MLAGLAESIMAWMFVVPFSQAFVDHNEELLDAEGPAPSNLRSHRRRVFGPRFVKGLRTVALCGQGALHTGREVARAAHESFMRL